MITNGYKYILNYSSREQLATTDKLIQLMRLFGRAHDYFNQWLQKLVVGNWMPHFLSGHLLGPKKKKNTNPSWWLVEYVGVYISYIERLETCILIFQCKLPGGLHVYNTTTKGRLFRKRLGLRECPEAVEWHGVRG